MTSPRSSLFRLLATIACALTFLLRPASAAVISLDASNFPDTEWSIMPYGTQAYNRPYAESASLHGHDWVLIERSATKTSNSANVIYNGGHTAAGGAPVSNPANQLGDFTGSVILGSSNPSSYFQGVILRGEEAPFKGANAYYLGISGSQELSLSWDVQDGWVTATNKLVTTTLSEPLGKLNQSNNHQYLLKFSFIGNTLEASLSIWDADANEKGTLLGSLSYTDTREEARSSGYFGIRGGRYGNVQQGYFRDLQVNVIPEPSSVALLLLSGGALWVACRRRKARSN